MAADAVITFTEIPNTILATGGRHVEFGLALAQAKRVIVVGPRYLAALLDIQLSFRNSRRACSMKRSANCFGVMPQAAASAAIAL